MAWSNLKPEAVPREWVDAMASVLEGDPATPELVAPAVATLRALPLTREKAGDLPVRLLRIAADAKNAADLRLAALAAVPGGLVNPDQKIFTFLDRPARSRADRRGQNDRGRRAGAGQAHYASSSSGWLVHCGLRGRWKSTGCWSPSSSLRTNHWV